MTTAGRHRDWFAWHRPYEDPASPLYHRLLAVRRRIGAALDGCPPGPIRAVSMCAGQGRDLLPVLMDHPRRADVRARLVELDPRNAVVARAASLDGVEVVTGDASITTAYEGMVPADLVLVCGVFGHATDEDIHHTIHRLPGLCGPGATVIWTRGGFEPDLRPLIRRWFTEAGFQEVGFETGGGETDWGVGATRLVGPPQPYEPGVRLFTFRDTP
ncbi:MAG: SAM-dependent methyltransferase [Actinomycetota bacterium]|nr:SAM-dependent methyltransferase [Actinomycetota bacterium]